MPIDQTTERTLRQIYAMGESLSFNPESGLITDRDGKEVAVIDNNHNMSVEFGRLFAVSTDIALFLYERLYSSGYFPENEHCKKVGQLLCKACGDESDASDEKKASDLLAAARKILQLQGTDPDLVECWKITREAIQQIGVSWQHAIEWISRYERMRDAHAPAQSAEKPVHHVVVEPTSANERDELTLKNMTQFERSRCLHRVVRAMHDGHCPACGHLQNPDVAREFNEKRGWSPLTCTNCNFSISRAEAADALAEFKPHMRRAYEIFEQWRASRS